MTQSETIQRTTGSLRERQKEYTRSLIFQALADLIIVGRIHDFTVQQVADEAGVSHRTVYRYFATREELLNAFSDWLDDLIAQAGGINMVAAAEDLPAAVVANFAVFDNLKNWMRAYVLTYLTTTQPVKGRTGRSQEFRHLLAAYAPNLPAEEIDEGAMLIRHLASSLSWYALQEHFGLQGKQAGQAVAWAVETLLQDLKRRSDRLAEAPPPGQEEDHQA